MNTSTKAERPALHSLLKDAIFEKIEKGEFPSSSKLPSEREMCEQLNTNRVTLRDALSQLETHGVIYRMNRRGWFVSAERIKYDPVEDVGFMRNVASQGQTPTTETIAKEEIKASDWLAKRLGIKKDQNVYYLQRRRLINDRPVLVEDIFLIAKRYPGLLHVNLDGSLSQVLKDIYNIKVAWSEIHFTPAALTDKHTDSLYVTPGTPGLLLTRCSYDKNGKVVEFDQEYWRHDVLNINVKTKRFDAEK
jgi:DNA-binding GntR family transcriptional regulator